ncbi:MAG: MBL fold metallo-hydrolase [Methylacidiphilales bacterium]|nr:MBL fold metallo-hydrolase [Candidatus Methylacidiphilales bacterium]MDW8349507.1 MBL fold metallo-hydrolase [Verrucomicrobiae bacterium]
MDRIPLEDSYVDIVRKALAYAQLASRLGDQALAREMQIPVEVWRDLKNGVWHENYGPRAAEYLGLNARALAEIAQNKWHPGEIFVPHLHQVVTPFSPTSVNAYICWHLDTLEACIVDTGMDADPILEFISRHKLSVKMILLTHGDGDHVYEVDRLMEKTGAPSFIHAREHIAGTLPVEEGDSFSLGTWTIEVLETPGHSPGGVTYLIRGGSPWVAFTGDAIMAGTMGKVRGDFESARKVLRKKILCLPDETVLAPGHGPLTTVGAEKRYNPFLAD